MAELSEKTLNTIADDVPAYDDVTGQYPKREYMNVASTNLAARGLVRNELYLGGGDHKLSLDLQPQLTSQYPLNQVRETVSGHVTEIDDTPGSERMLFRHRTGAGIELRADGTVIVSSTNNTIRITGGDEKVIVEGDGHITYNGNLTLDVTGDMDLKVGGDMNLRVAGDRNTEILGSDKTIVHRSSQSTTHHNTAEYVLGVKTSTVLGDRNSITKGGSKAFVEGGSEILSGGTLILTAEEEVVFSSPNVNIAADDLTVIGEKGTIGGDNIVYYGHTAHIDRVNSTSIHATNSVHATVGMEAPTFNGNLSGNASTAGTAGTAALGPSGGSAQSTVTLTPADNKTTVEPTETIMDDYLNKSNKGVRKVKIDPSEVMKNQIDKSFDYNGIATRKLTTEEIRSKMRDPITAANKKFVSAQIAEGKLSASYINSIPPAIGRTVSNDAQPRRGSERIGPSNGQKVRFEK